MPALTPPSDPAPANPQDEVEILALVEGRLDERQETTLLARAERDPVLAAAIARQRAARKTISDAVAETSAPHALRLRIDELASAPEPRRRRARWLPLAGIAAAAAAVAIALVIAPGERLDVRGTLAAATRAPVAAVVIDPLEPRLLRERVEQVPFPNFAKRFGWKAVGTRTDEVDGRSTRTVFYERDGNRIAYTIVEGDALPEPSGARSISRDGVGLRVFSDGERTVVTWRRLGHTCVLSSADVAASELVKLASWKAKGAVTF